MVNSVQNNEKFHWLLYHEEFPKKNRRKAIAIVQFPSCCFRETAT